MWTEIGFNKNVFICAYMNVVKERDRWNLTFLRNSAFLFFSKWKPTKGKEEKDSPKYFLDSDCFFVNYKFIYLLNNSTLSSDQCVYVGSICYTSLAFKIEQLKREKEEEKDMHQHTPFEFLRSGIIRLHPISVLRWPHIIFTYYIYGGHVLMHQIMLYL